MNRGNSLAATTSALPPMRRDCVPEWRPGTAPHVPWESRSLLLSRSGSQVHANNESVVSPVRPSASLPNLPQSLSIDTSCKGTIVQPSPTMHSSRSPLKSIPDDSDSESTTSDAHALSRSSSSVRINPVASAEGRLPADHFSNRLFNTPKWVSKAESVNDSIVSDLPDESLRWIKKRRSMDSNQRVVISYIRNSQLREMFSKLDFNNEGSIDLEELTGAIKYVNEKLKGRQGAEHFAHLDKVFAEMDDNGDGTVDYQEFTKGMTGTAKSAFDKASSYELEKLFNLFIEYGNLRKHALALEAMQRRPSTSMCFSTVSSKPSTPAQGLVSSSSLMSSSAINSPSRNTDIGGNNDPTDAHVYQSFKVLFGESHPQESVSIAQMGLRRIVRDEETLRKFVHSNEIEKYGCLVTNNDDMSVALSTAKSSKSAKSASISDVTEPHLRKEKMYHNIYIKHKYMRKDFAHDLATDLGVLEIQQTLAHQRKVHLPERLPHIRECADSALLSTIPATAATAKRPTSRMDTSKTRSDLTIRLQARQEAFALLRQNRGTFTAQNSISGKKSALSGRHRESDDDDIQQQRSLSTLGSHDSHSLFQHPSKADRRLFTHVSRSRTDNGDPSVHAGAHAPIAIDGSFIFPCS